MLTNAIKQLLIKKLTQALQASTAKTEENFHSPRWYLLLDRIKLTGERV
ncbi:hypothetical protein AAGS61_15250 [Lysinibacillus sp. KU-BSD001]